MLNPEKARNLLSRMAEHNADFDQLIGRLNTVYELALESTEERVNPKLDVPVEVKVRNLAVARAAVMDIYHIHKELLSLATPGRDDDTVITYELIKTFVSPDEDWQP